MSGLRYKKDGSLDMRFSSSKAAMSGGSRGYSTPSPSYSSYSSGYGSSSSTPQPLHHKKDGSLDMRFSSSKQASPVSYSYGSSSNAAEPLHSKKDGSLDMRYSSSKQSVGSNSSSSSRNQLSSQSVHLKKDGTPDMRFSSSKQLLDLGCTMKSLSIDSKRIASGIPLTKSGLPDMRTKAAKDWVKDQAAKANGNIPSWVPRKKDGAVDNNKAVAQIFLASQICNIPNYNINQRIEYYDRKLKDNTSGFTEAVRSARHMVVSFTESDVLPNTKELRKALQKTMIPAGGASSNSDDLSNLIPDTIQTLDPELLKPFIKNANDAIGTGSFGSVYKGKRGGFEVAIKKLHLAKLSAREKLSFVKELKILGVLGEHPNLVKLYGYTLDPPCIVMEFVQLGSLSYLLYTCEDSVMEASLSDGRVKKKIVVGIVQGMRQLHAVNVVHGDLKPQNILISSDYTAKISDFGLATLRGKSSSTLASTMAQSEDGTPGGTAGYMAPELLDSSSAPELSSDVYSFAVLFNEILQEEEPFSSDFRKFHGRGPFAAANFAKLGNRPAINQENGDKRIYELIRKCWHKTPDVRPTFDMIRQTLLQDIHDFPNSFNF